MNWSLFKKFKAEENLNIISLKLMNEDFFANGSTIAFLK